MRTRRTRRKGGLARVLLIVGLASGVLAASAGAAQASYTWSPKGVSYLFGGPRVALKTTTTVNNNTQVTMQCWQWGNWYTSAYASDKWFRVRIIAWNFVTWMHSSNVYAQTAVPRC